MNTFNKKNGFVLLRKFIYSLLYCADRLFMRRNNIFILCYHSISSDDWFYSVKFVELKKQIEHLRKDGYSFVTLDDIYDHVTGGKPIKSPSVAITIDDGYSDIVHTLDYFHDEKITPALFLVSTPERINRKQLGSNKKLLNSLEIKKIQRNGWEIGAHSATHSDLSKLSNEKLTVEASDSKKDLESALGAEVSYFAYPFGSYNDEVLDKVRSAGYKMVLSMDDGEIKKGINLYKIPRIGVNNTHSITEFRTIFSPSVISFRNFIKRRTNN